MLYLPVCIAECIGECILQEWSLSCIDWVGGWQVAGLCCTSQCAPAQSEVYCCRVLEEKHIHDVNQGLLRDTHLDHLS